MTVRFSVNKLLLLVFLIILIDFDKTLAQAPIITYPATPANYPLNTTITPLVPNNKGGAVPATIYGNVTTFARGVASPHHIIVDKSGNFYVSDQSAGNIKKITPTGAVSVFASKGATSINFSGIEGLAIDNAGNIYATVSNDQQILKISPSGTASLFAGTGIAGSDDGPVQTATFASPTGIAVDPLGIIYVADGGNHCIRKITTNGVVSTLAGNPNIAGYQDGAGSLAYFAYPYDLTIDKNGDLMVTDGLNNLIRKVTSAGVVTTIAGNTAGGSNDGTGSAAGFNLPIGIITDAAGNFYIADAGDQKIRRMTPGGTVVTIAGTGQPGSKNGPASTATFWYPFGLVFGPDNSLYVADDNNYLIRKITLSGYTIDKPLPPGLAFDQTTGIISGTPTAASPATQYTITAYNGKGNSSAVVTIAVGRNTVPSVQPPKFTYPTPNNYTVNTPITPIGPTTLGGAVPATIFGNVSTFAGQDIQSGYKDATGNLALFSNLWGIDMDASGNLYVADDSRIRKVTPGAVVTTLAGGNLNGVSDGIGTAAGFGQTAGLTVTPSGNIVVGDILNKTIRQVTPAGAVITIAGNGINNFDPAGVASGSSGDIFVADQANDIVRDFTSGGSSTIYSGTQGSAGSGNGGIATSTYNNPADLKFDQSGDLFIADENSNMIREITAGGLVSTVAGKNNPGLQDGPVANALFNKPLALTMDPVNNIYVADARGLVIRMIDARGVVVSVAGNNANSISRDGIGPEATFAKVSGLVYSNGIIFATDRTCIRQIIVTGYSIDKQLPNGLVFDSATGTISGTPTTPSPATDYTITGYNTGGSYSFIVNIEVDLPAPPQITYPTPEVYTRYSAIAPLVPTNKGGAASATSTSSAYTIDKTLPAGLTLDPLTGIISGIPTAISPSTDYNITAHNDGGTNTFTVNITVVSPILPDEVITFNPLPVKTYGDADFDPGATSNDNLVPIEYTTDDATVATIVNGQVHITGAGTTNITATQPGDIHFNGAYPVIQTFTVKKALLTITVDDVSRFAGQPNPNFILHYAGLVNGETEANLTTQAIATTAATEASPPGTYPIDITGASSPNYDIHSIAGTLTVVAIPPSVVVPNAFKPNGDGINDFWNIKSIEAYPKCTISVYSRYGTLIYQSKGYPRSWDGTSNGSPVPTGTYYYIINLNEGSTPQLSGYVAVIR